MDINLTKVERYFTIRDSDDGVFDASINTQLQEGWTLYGSPYVDEEGYYCQALIQPFVSLTKDEDKLDDEYAARLGRKLPKVNWQDD